MNDSELVLHETNITLASFPERLRSLIVDCCKVSMGELLVLVERVEAIDARKGKMLRDVWTRRDEMRQLRALLGR